MTQLRRLNTGDKLPLQCRFLTLDLARRAAGDDEPIVDPSTRELALTFSSETPVSRWFGDEVLSHAPGSADLARANDGAPLLFNHNANDVIGVVERASIGDDRRGHATVRFARNARGDEIVGLINDRILRNVSFMYEADEYVATELDGDGDVDTYTARQWRVYELSIVSIPADQSIGIERAAGGHEKSVRVHRPERADPAASTATPLPHEEPMNSNRNMQYLDAAVDGTSGGAAAITAVDLEKIRVDARNAEVLRVREIEAIAKQHKVPADKAAEWIRAGTDVAAVRGFVLDSMLARGPVADFGHQDIDLTAKEKSRYSILRAIGASLNKDWSAAGFEREVSLELAKKSGKSSEGFFVPMNLPFAPDEEHARAYAMLNSRGAQVRSPYLVGAAGQGGNLVATNLLADSFIEVLRNQSVTALLGARLLSGLTGNVDIPRQASQTATYWVGESTALTEAEATFDKVQLRPKTIGALSRMSRLMILQATPAIEMLARQDLLAVMALGLDLAAISGSGSSNQPTGIVNQSGVASVVGGANGASLTFDHIIQLQYATKFANAPQASTGYALNSKAIGYLSTLKASTGQYLWDPMGGLTNSSPDRLKGRSYAESQQLRSTLTKGTSTGICSELVYGNWQELLIASWGTLEILANPYDSVGFTTGDVLIRALQTADIGVRHGASFAVMSDALTPGF